VTNKGTITGAGDTGVKLTADGAVTNSGVASAISGRNFGVYVYGAGTVSNAGTITNTDAGYGTAAVQLFSGGVVTNTGISSAIRGGNAGVQALLGAATVTNAGTISGTNSFGVFLLSGGVVTNSAKASAISGGYSGIVSFSPATVSNSGTITGTGHAGVELFSGGLVANNGAASVISGGDFGVRMPHYGYGTPGTVTKGRITGASSDGIELSTDGVVTNSGGASSISGGNAGVRVFGYGSAATVTNAGTITGTSANGVGVVFADLGGTQNNTLIDSGRIIGNSGTAVQFGDGNDLLRLLPGASFTGLVDGGGGSNTLELAKGPSPGTIGGIGTSFTGFGAVTVDTGANWTVTGSNTAGTVANNGTLALGAHAHLAVTSAIDPASTGVFQLNSSSLLEVAANVGSGDRISFLGSSETIVDKASLFGTNVGQQNYTGPLLLNFGAGDSVDLKDIASAGVSLNYTSSTGLLQVSSGAAIASLLFQRSSLGGGVFHTGDDGSGHTLITHT
jgi:hypothetical protein